MSGSVEPQARYGEMKRLVISAKGNVDVHDALHSCRIAGKVEWNGINAALKDREPKCTVRLRHETWTRSDALLASSGSVPAGLAARALELGFYPLASQFSRALFTTEADAVVLSIQPDIMSELVRHRREGYLLYPADHERWKANDREWLASEFEPTGLLSVEASMANLAAIVFALRTFCDAPVLVLNVSSLTPGEHLHCYRGFEETLSTRIKAFNLGLIRLSEATGVSIVDVDALVSRHGGDALKVDTIHLTPRGHELVAREVVRVLDDLGVFEPNP